jgi:hypothetical protein
MRSGQQRLRRSTWGLVGCLGLLGLTGCSRESGPQVFPVHGQVRVDGKLAAHAQVTFHPVGDSRPDAVHPAATTDEQGNFSLTSYTAGDGAPEGEYQVAVVWFLASKPRGPGEESTTRNHLPERYGRAESSQLRATVSKGDNTLKPFDLKRN